MIYLKLFYEFLKVGLFSFGGGYTSIPLIKDIVITNKWLTYETYLDLVAIAESTPGPIMVNVATYVGCKQAGALGAFISLIASILPAFLILLLFAMIYKHISSNKKINYMFSILRPAIIGIIFAAGVELLFKSLISETSIIQFVKNIFKGQHLLYLEEIKKVIVLIMLLFIMFLYKKIKNKKINSIMFIFIAAILGIFVFGFNI